ncbi:MAG: MaoC/PaaZ C-terminal domain-containing protein [Polyangiales bacterium]
MSNRHILEQGAALSALGRVALRTLEQQLRGRTKTVPVLPGPTIEATLPPRSAALVRDYIVHVGGDPAAYRGSLPPHLFPQWTFGLASQVLEGLPYPLARVINAGCELTQNMPLPADEPLLVRAHLESIDDDGRRAMIRTRAVTSTPSAKDALITDIIAMVPLKRGGGGNGKPRDAKEREKDVARVPESAREVARFKLGASAGLDFAKLTGDFNPIHWVRPAARAAGFPSVILHGFGTMARALEGLSQGVLGGDPSQLRKWQCRFTKPLVLPAQAGVFTDGKQVFVGGALGAPAYLVGSYET